MTRRLGRIALVALLVVAEIATLAGIAYVLRTAMGERRAWSLRRGLLGTGGPVEMRKEQFIPLADLEGTLFVRNDVGSIVLQGGTSGFGVRAVLRGFGTSEADAEESLGLVDLVVDKTAEGTLIEARTGRGWWGRRPHWDLEVTLPHGAKADLFAAMGSVTVHDWQGALRVEASMGRVTVVDFAGDLTTLAKMGSVEIERVDIEEVLDVEANMGSVKFAGNLGHTNSIRANMGSITVVLRREHPAVQLQARLNMGKLHNDLPFAGESSRERVNGVLGTGTPQGSLELHADMGKIDVRSE